MMSFDKRAAALTEALQYFAGENSVDDAKKSGYIRCVHDLLKVELDDLKETE